MSTAHGANGTVEFDGTFVRIHRTNMLGRSTVGKGSKSIPVRSITAVQWKPPGAMVNGFIEFTIAGGNEARSRLGGATAGAARNENAVIVKRKQAAEFEQIRAEIEQAIARL